MSDKPREFWILDIEPNNVWEDDVGPVITTDVCFLSEIEKHVRVIEKSAYDELEHQLKIQTIALEKHANGNLEIFDKLRARADKLAEALERLHAIFVENGDYDLRDICFERLAEYRGEK